MKKVVWCMILALILPLFPVIPALGEDAATDSAMFVLEDYENGTLGETAKVVGATTKPEVTASDTAGNSKGAMHVKTSSDFGSVSYDFGSKKDYTYDISVWIKVAETPLKDEVHFIIYNLSKEDGKTSLYRDIAVKNAGLQKDKWVKVSAVFECDGMGRKVGGGDFETIPIGSTEIRIGSGRPSETMASGVIEYVMDDFVIMPREKYVPQAGELITNGSFEDEDFLNGWSFGNSAEVTKITPGANGTGSAVNIRVKSNWGTITQPEVDIRFGRSYSVSFWAKATSSEAVGQKMQFILDRSKRKTDQNVPNYEYITDPNNLYLSEEWQRYEMTYSNSLMTEDSVKPNFYFRAGDGQQQVSYAVDELTVTELGQSDILNSVSYLSGVIETRSVSGYASVSGGLVSHSVYRVIVPFEGDYAIVKSGKEPTSQFHSLLGPKVNLNSLKLVVQATDDYGNVGKPVTTDIHITKPVSSDYAKKAVAEFRENIWNEDIKQLTGTVSYLTDNPEEGTLLAVAAVYGKNGQLLETTQKLCTINEAGETSAELAVNADGEAKSAKLFLWGETSLSPLKAEDKIEKTEGGTYIYVDPVNGKSSNSGSLEAPLATLSQAKNKVRNLIKTAQTDVYVVFYPGEYKISSTLQFGERDYSESVNLVYTSLYKTDRAQFTGGTDVTGFQLYDENKGIYRAKVPVGTMSRQLFVNGVRAVKARNEGPLQNAQNVKAEDGTTPLGIKTSDVSLKDFRRIDDIELVFYEKWTNPRCQVSEIQDNGDGTITLVMDAVGWKAMSNKGGTSVTVPQYIENALELLDEEGEWYLDSVDGYVYYKPRFFENLDTARVILPTTEKLVAIEGKSVSEPIKNISFDNIEFAYSTWNRPSTENGHSDAQNNHIRQNGDRLVDGAVEVKNAHNVNFTNCDFNRLGTTALRLTDAIQGCNIVGNEFYELSAGAVNLGDPQNKSDNSQVVNPTDPEYFITDNAIENNYIHKIGVDFMSAAAISAGFPKNTTIANNELYGMPYSGMHIGYGWASLEESGAGTVNLKIVNNYIHDVMNDRIFDGGAIYTLGMTGGTWENPNIISENYIYDVGNQYGALYTDEGSAFWSLTKNVIDLSPNPVWRGSGSTVLEPRWLHVHTSSIHDNTYSQNYATTTNDLMRGTNCVYEPAILISEGHLPEEALDIINRSGITAGYRQNFKYGLQRVENVESLTLTTGESVLNNPVCFTVKNAFYTVNGLEMYARSSNEQVATVENNVITARALGTAEITYYFIEQGILKTTATTVTVK
ncbi:MAG TPA: hypothetical protein DD391_06520 [Clostridiales bacterium]|nr:hypothetical protein [Clostridiales bacterium]HBL82239.1 hypothetical protein [Clostridiales bacterium]